MNRCDHTNRKSKTVAMIMLLFLCLLIPSCMKKADPSASSVIIEDTYNSKEELYIFQNADTENSTLHMVNVDTGADAVFTYAGRTEILTYEGESTVVERLECGELVKVVYNTKDDILNYVHVAKDRWKIDTSGNYLSRQPDIGAIKVENNVYKLNSNYVIYSNNEKIDMDNILEKDQITVRGIGNVAYTVTVTSGHGTLRLNNASAYIGGWIEVGKVISVIKEGMILDVPEGDYNAILTRHGYKGEIVVSIARGKDEVIDCSKLKETKSKTGIVNFYITPTDAEIYLNGSKLNSKGPLELTYGKYYLAIKAPGYTTYGGTMVLNSTRADINISLTRDSSTQSSSSSSSRSSGSGTTSSGTSRSSTSASTSTASSSSLTPSQRQSMIESVQEQMQSLQNSILQNSLLNTSN